MIIHKVPYAYDQHFCSQYRSYYQHDDESNTGDFTHAAIFSLLNIVRDTNHIGIHDAIDSALPLRQKGVAP